MKPLLTISGLKTYFYTDEGVVKSVDGVDIVVGEGETVGVVGESGCGKSVTSLSIMRLIPSPPGRIAEGRIEFEGQDLLTLSEPKMRQIRGNEIAMIFQEPMSSLNPAFTIGDQIQETLRLHLGLNRKQAAVKSVELLRQVGIPRAEAVVNEYPHQLSGGMRQRVMIAMAMACNPKLLIADEPTTALDVTIQAQILELMRKIQSEFGTAILLITHDLGVVAEMCDRVVVMYAGRIVEQTDSMTLFDQPRHPYTQGLLTSIPKIDERTEYLHSIPGNVPTPLNLPAGCKFASRCPHVMNVCLHAEPPLQQIPDQETLQEVRCWLYHETPAYAETQPEGAAQ